MEKKQKDAVVVDRVILINQINTFYRIIPNADERPECIVKRTKGGFTIALPQNESSSDRV